MLHLIRSWIVNKSHAMQQNTDSIEACGKTPEILDYLARHARVQYFMQSARILQHAQALWPLMPQLPKFSTQSLSNSN
jgi:hypothetical protein